MGSKITTKKWANRRQRRAIGTTPILLTWFFSNLKRVDVNTPSGFVRFNGLDGNKYLVYPCTRCNTSSAVISVSSGELDQLEKMAEENGCKPAIVFSSAMVPDGEPNAHPFIWGILPLEILTVCPPKAKGKCAFKTPDGKVFIRVHRGMECFYQHQTRKILGESLTSEVTEYSFDFCA